MVTTFKKPLIGALVLVLLLAVFVLKAHAAMPPTTAALVDQIKSQLKDKFDSTLQKDLDQYEKLNISGRFGVTFKPHVDVCSTPGSGEATCDARVITDANGTPQASATLPAGYGPQQFIHAYNLPTTITGHPLVAIVDAYDDPNIASDLNTYSDTYGIPRLSTCSGPVANSQVACFQKVNQNGSTTQHPSTNSGWALEISLDVETVHATCPSCSILLVEANSSSYNNLLAAVDKAVALGAKVVSNSYGGGEFSGQTSYDGHFNKPGVVFTFSSGDSGYGTQYPASSPYVVAVGGTSLFLNSDGSYNQELAWSGAGSGCSAYESKPAWQTDTKCAKRTVADVSADADPNTGAAVYDSVYYYGRRGWWQVGGTSLAAPLVASAYALSGNIPANTQENSLPYQNTANLNDVTSGSNGSCGTYLCNAAVGYDGPTGLGSPKGALAF
jgi:subtilase family serine protease